MKVGLVLVAAVGGVICTAGGCERLEDPCVVSAELPIAGVPGATAGTFVATEARTPAVLFLSREATPDAGLNAGAFATIPTGATVLVLDEAHRGETRRETFKAPARLAARKGSTSSPGIIWLGGAALFHWVESTTTTEPDGRTKTSAKLVLQTIDSAGVEKPAVEPPEMKCDDCRLDVAGLHIRGTTLITFAITPAALAIGGLGGPATQPRVGAFAIGPSGEILPRALPAIIANQPRGLPRFDVIDGTLVLVGSMLVPVDGDLNVVGPVLPRPGVLETAAILDGDPILVWASATQVDAGREALLPSEPNVLVQRFDRSGRPISNAQRITTSPAVQAIARSGDRLGVVHRSGKQYFALARINGEKIGGDIVVSDTSANDDVRLFGESSSFHLLSVSDGRVVRREMTCAP